MAAKALANIACFGVMLDVMMVSSLSFPETLMLFSVGLELATPGRHEIFRDLDDRIERKPDDREQEEDREDVGGVEGPGCLQQDVAEALVGPDKLGNDRCGGSNGRRGLEA